MYNLPINRRQFIQKAVDTALGLSGSFIFRPTRVHAQTPELTLLSWNNFVPTADEKLKEQAARFAKEQGVLVRVDTIDVAQIAAKLATEAHAGAGHDIVILWEAFPWLYSDVKTAIAWAEEQIRKILG